MSESQEGYRMGFDITAFDEINDEVAYLRTYMGAFRMLREQGFDWFKLIGAKDCDCGVSGCGETRLIWLDNLERALEMLRKHNPEGKLSSEGRDEWTHRKPLLEEFMVKCIKHCRDNDINYISIYFG